MSQANVATSSFLQRGTRCFGMASDTEWLQVPDRDFVRLQGAFGKVFVVHDGTGEQFELEVGEDEAIWSLSFSSVGVALVESSSGAALLPQHIFKSRLCTKAGGDGQMWVVRPSAEPIEHVVLANQFRCRAHCMSLKGMPPWVAEVYMYNLRRKGAFNWWCFPWVRKMLWPEDRSSNFVSAHLNELERAMKVFGIAADRLQKSIHAARMKSLHGDDAIANTAGLGQEWCISTLGLLAVVLHACRLRSGKAAKTKDNETAEAMLSALVDACFAKHRHDIVFDEWSSGEVRIEGGCIYVQDDVEGMTRFLARAFPRRRHMDDGVPVHRFLLEAQETLACPSKRAKGVDVIVLSRLTNAVLQAANDALDTTRLDDEKWSKDSLFALLPSPRKAKVERISLSFKAAVAARCSENADVGDIGTVMAVQGAMSKAMGSTDVSGAKANKNKAMRENMFQYAELMKNHHARLQRFHISSDGVRIGGEDTNPTIFTAAETKMLSFGAPQVQPQDVMAWWIGQLHNRVSNTPKHTNTNKLKNWEKGTRKVVFYF